MEEHKKRMEDEAVLMNLQKIEDSMNTIDIQPQILFEASNEKLEKTLKHNVRTSKALHKLKNQFIEYYKRQESQVEELKLDKNGFLKLERAKFKLAKAKRHIELVEKAMIKSKFMDESSIFTPRSTS